MHDATLIAHSCTGPATSARLNYPIGVAMDSLNTTLYIADTSNGAIRVVNPAGVISLVAGVTDANWCDNFGNRVTSTIARLQNVYALVSDGAGGFTTQDYYNSIVRYYSGPDAIVTTIAGTSVAGYSDGGPATAAKLSAPSGLTTDGANGFYIAMSGSNVLQRLTPLAQGYNLTTVAGRNGSAGYS